MIAPDARVAFLGLAQAARRAGLGTGVWSSLEEALGAVRETGRTHPGADAARACDRLSPVHAERGGLLARATAALAEASR